MAAATGAVHMEVQKLSLSPLLFFKSVVLLSGFKLS